MIIRLKVWVVQPAHFRKSGLDTVGSGDWLATGWRLVCFGVDGDQRIEWTELFSNSDTAFERTFEFSVPNSSFCC